MKTSPAVTGVAVPRSWQGAGPNQAVAVTDTAPDLSRWWETLGDATLCDLVARAVAANPDLRRARASLREARARRALVGKGLLPDVTATVAASTTRARNQPLADLTAPLFDRRRIGLQIQSAAQEQALAAYDAVVLTALEDVENALVALVNAGRRQDSRAEGRLAARNTAELAREQYTAGLVSYQTVLDTERSVLSIEDSLKTAEAQRTTALVQLYKALGGGWEPASAAASGGRPASEES